jgi:hypothetical protein
MMRRRLKQTTTLEQRLQDHAARLRKQAEGTPHGFEREMLLRRARQTETASHVNEWLSSKELQAPTR